MSQMQLSSLEVAAKKFSADKYRASDESHAGRCSVHCREMWLKRVSCLYVLLQHELFLPIQTSRSYWSAVRAGGLPFVHRTQGKDGVQHGGFACARLKQQGVPEARDVGTRELRRRATLEPFVIAFFRGIRCNKMAGWKSPQHGVLNLGACRALALTVEVPTATPNPVAIADPAG
jgi:hypothetical protein